MVTQGKIEWKDPVLEPDNGTVSAGLRYLVQSSGKTVKEIADGVHVSANSIYTIMHRNSNKADILVLKRLADYFDVDITIFCGVGRYDPPKKLDEQEQLLLTTYNSLTDAAKARIDEYISDVAGNPKNRRGSR